LRSEARIIDASLNRALEGLRVLEDIARFALDDAPLSGELKASRHDLAEAVRPLLPGRGLAHAARDAAGDVGTGVSTQGERTRPSLASVAAAAGGRAAEAMRSLEEMAKCVGGEPRRIETIRYRVYDLAARVGAGLVPAGRQWRLCVLITGSLCPGGDWERVARASIEGGADCLQLREKHLPDGELLERARRLVGMTRDAGVDVAVNDRPDIALLAGADAVHVGQTDLSPSDVRAVAGHRMPVGVSTSSISEALMAARSGASSVGLGGMFPSSTKAKDSLAGPAYLRAFLADDRVSRLPHLCIGGITPENAAELADAGARGLAVSAAVCGAPDPAGVCAALLDALGGPGNPVDSTHGD
jgi:thiamine-phosphate pyrophosphorylase